MLQGAVAYDWEWFKRRAFSSLKKVDENTWDFSDSLLLYISSGVELYEDLQEKDSPYFNLVTKPEREYLAVIAKDIATMLPNDFDYIDLGPGTEHKEQFFFDEFKALGKSFTYIPVDISKYYIELAEKHAQNQGISVNGVQSSFEELPLLLGSATRARFVNLGLTFSNYAPEVILKLLQDIAGQGGYAFINSHIRDRVDMVALEKVYAADAISLADEKLKLIGLDPASDVTPRETNQEVRAWCTVIHTNDELRAIGINDGIKLIVFQSLRYTKDSLESVLKTSTTSYQTFDTGSSFIATMIKT